MVKQETRKGLLTTSNMVKIAMLSAVSYVLMLFEFPLPGFPPFLQIDLSEIPVIVGAVAMGPLCGIFIELVKNILHLFNSTTFGVGELANFCVGISLVVPIGLFYKKKKDISHYVLGSVIGTILMIIVACIFNYYIMLPLFAKLSGVEVQAFADMAGALNSRVKDVRTLIVFAFAPFNFIKAVVVSIIGYFVCKVLKPIFK